MTNYLASYPLLSFLVHAVCGKPPTMPRQSAVVPCLAQLLCLHAALLQVGGQPAPEGISQAAVVHCLAQQAEQLGAFKLARMAHTRLQLLRLPPAWQVGRLWLCLALCCCCLPMALSCPWAGQAAFTGGPPPTACWSRVILLQDQSLHPGACAAMQVWQLCRNLLCSIGCSQNSC